MCLHSSQVTKAMYVRIQARDLLVVVGSGKAAIDILQGLQPSARVLWAHRGHTAFFDRAVIEAQFECNGEDLFRSLGSYAERSVMTKEHWSISAFRDGWLISCHGQMTRRAVSTGGGICSLAELAHADGFSQMDLGEMYVSDGGELVLAPREGGNQSRVTLRANDSVIFCTGQRNNSFVMPTLSARFARSGPYTLNSGALTALVPLRVALEQICADETGSGGTEVACALQAEIICKASVAAVLTKTDTDSRDLEFSLVSALTPVVRTVLSGVKVDVAYLKEWIGDWYGRDINVIAAMARLTGGGARLSSCSQSRLGMGRAINVEAATRVSHETVPFRQASHVHNQLCERLGASKDGLPLQQLLSRSDEAAVARFLLQLLGQEHHSQSSAQSLTLSDYKRFHSMCCESDTAICCAHSFDQGCVVIIPFDSVDTGLDAHVQQLTALSYYQLVFLSGAGLSTHAGLSRELEASEFSWTEPAVDHSAFGKHPISQDMLDSLVRHAKGNGFSSATDVRLVRRFAYMFRPPSVGVANESALAALHVTMYHFISIDADGVAVTKANGEPLLHLLEFFEDDALPSVPSSIAFTASGSGGSAVETSCRILTEVTGSTVDPSTKYESLGLTSMQMVQFRDQLSEALGVEEIPSEGLMTAEGTVEEVIGELSLGSPAPEDEVAASAVPGHIEQILIAVGDGLEFSALAAGPMDGECVILLHGFPETSRMWLYQLEALARVGYRVAAPDQRGYSTGARPVGAEAYKMPLLCDDVLRIADALGATRFHLVGHDWGGAVAWHLAASHAERLLSLIVLSTPHPAVFAAALDGPLTGQAIASSYMRDLMRADSHEMLLADGGGLLFSGFGLERLTRANKEAYLAVLTQPGALEAACHWYRANDPHDTAKGVYDVSAVTVPTTFIWSTGDDACTRAAG